MDFVVPIGTHDVTAATTSVLGSERVKITYARHSNARGALFIFGFITNSGDVDFNISFLIALDRSTSHNHTLPFDLYPEYMFMTLNMMQNSTMEWDTLL